MTLRAGDTWDEDNPSDSTLTVQIDDHIVDLRVGVGNGMRQEHDWPHTGDPGGGTFGVHKEGECGVLAMVAAANLPTTNVIHAIAYRTDTKLLVCNDGTDWLTLDIDHGALSGLGDADHSALTTLTADIPGGATYTLTGMRAPTEDGEALRYEHLDAAYGTGEAHPKGKNAVLHLDQLICYDSGWKALGKGESLALPHNFGSVPAAYFMFFDAGSVEGKVSCGHFTDDEAAERGLILRNLTETSGYVQMGKDGIQVLKSNGDARNYGSGLVRVILIRGDFT